MNVRPGLPTVRFDGAAIESAAVKTNTHRKKKALYHTKISKKM